MEISEGPTQKSVYAFVGWITTIVFYIIFLIWAYTPDNILHSFGITYYPSRLILFPSFISFLISFIYLFYRYFAISIPAYIIIVYLLSVVLYIGINMMITPDPEEICTIRDQYTRYVPNSFIRYNSRDGIPDIGDIDPRYVSKILADSQLLSTNHNKHK